MGGVVILNSFLNFYLKKQEENLKVIQFWLYWNLLLNFNKMAEGIYWDQETLIMLRNSAAEFQVRGNV